jgi:hypothetical protein
MFLQDPYEIWQSFEEGSKNGRVVMRRRYLKSYLDTNGRHIIFVADSQCGGMTGYSFMERSGDKKIEKLRHGWLMYGK